MANVAFIKPNLETDATWEMVRTSAYLGLWFMASKLKASGHDVLYLDEVVRDGGLKRTKLYETTLDVPTGAYSSRPLDVDLATYRKDKNHDFTSLPPAEFVAKYSAFRQPDKISRVIATTGNTPVETIERLSSFNPDYICISLIASANVRAALKLGKALADHFPAAKLIYGGQHVSACADTLARENPWIDFLITGDGIQLIGEVVEGRASARILHGGFRPLEEFPILDLSIIASTGYPFDQQYSYPSFGRKSVDFMFSKGCFRKCEFCVAGGQKGNYASLWDWDTIDEQLRAFKDAGVEELIVQDDAFFSFRDRASVLQKKLELMKKYDFFWQDSGGIDFELLNNDVTDLLVDYNRTGVGRFTGAYIPFNPRRWNRGKSATRSMVSRYDRCFENLNRLRAEGSVYVFTSDIVGTPEHTRETVQRDVQVHKDMISGN